MAVKQPNAIVSQRIEVGPELIKLRVIPDGWELPEFTPGQFASLGLAGTTPRVGTKLAEDRPPKDPDKLIIRAYSIASSSKAKEFVEFYIGLVHTGALSPRDLILSCRHGLVSRAPCTHGGVHAAPSCCSAGLESISNPTSLKNLHSAIVQFLILVNARGRQQV
jgi:hypothetical protein